MEIVNEVSKAIAKSIEILTKFCEDNDYMKDEINGIDEVIVMLQIALDKLVDKM